MTDHNTKRQVKRPRSPSTVYTAGEMLESGTLIELVCVKAKVPELRLLIWEKNRAQIVPSFIQDGVTYAPAQFESSVLRAIRFPTTVGDYGSAHELFGELSGLISRVTRVPDDDAERIAFFVIATYFLDCLPVAPCL